MFITRFVCVLSILLFIWGFHAIVLNPSGQQCEEGRKKIGLCITATGPYIEYVERLLASADRYFMLSHDVTYFVFTDSDFVHEKTKTIYQSRLGWPYDSMMRFDIYCRNADLFIDFDYLYAIDADMVFASQVDNEILSERVATVLSVHMFDPIKPYEPNPLSTAYVHVAEGKHYFAGAFYGGTKDAFMHLIKKTNESIHTDLARGYIAWANDESHLNRYFTDMKPTKILSPSYCHFEHWRSPYEKKIVAIDDKNYAVTRMPSEINPLHYFKQELQKVCA